MKPLSGNILLCIYMYIYMNLYVYVYVMVSVLVILRSTTGPYGRPILEVAYGEMLCSLHRGCMRVDSSGRVVGVSTWCRPCWTYPGQHQCGLTVYRFFLDFHTIITKKYIYGFQTYTLYKRTLVISDLVLAWQGSEKYFRPPICFKHIV